ncbi:hypothetical protein ABC795_09005 [Blastococcus sp. HT6-30]|uniref:hypothetical protein n=1 Tax=Blastococcus sp. HT6-30 TaxID=3144843 RepID=UPI00321B6C2E
MADARQPAERDDWLPDGLQQDLRELHDVPADQRAERLQDVLRSGLDGEYGGEVEQWTQQLEGFPSSVPEDLRDDLGQLSGQEPGQLREDLGDVVVDSARSGQYGLGLDTRTGWAGDAAERSNLSRALDGTSGDGGN